SAVKTCERLRHTVELAEGDAPTVVDGGAVWIELEGNIELPHGLSVTASLRVNDAEQELTLEMLGLSFDDLAVDLLGFPQAPGLMQRSGLRECQGQLIRLSHDLVET